MRRIKVQGERREEIDYGALAFAIFSAAKANVERKRQREREERERRAKGQNGGAR